MKTEDERHRAVRRVLVIEGLCNLAVLVAKAVVGLATGSLGVLGDAIHSFADVANNVVALVVVRLAAAPPDREHPYGHQKFETLAVFGLATLLAVLSVEIVVRALEPEAHVIVEKGWALAVMVGVLLVNVGLTLWERHWARKLDSQILVADSQHTLADVLTSIVVIAGWQLAARGFPWLDRVFALFVAALVMYLAYGLFQRAIPVLVDQMAEKPEEMADHVRSLDGVLNVKRIRSRSTGSSGAVDVVITVAPELPTIEAHEVADAVERALQEQFAISDVTVHVEPDDDSRA